MEFIAGDIGGTKAILALFSTESGELTVRAEGEFACRNYASFSDILQKFTEDKAKNFRPTHAYIGVAGPVSNGRSRLTNIDWQLSEETLSREFGFERVRLLNDLVAIGNYVPFVKQGETTVLNEGVLPEGEDGGAIGVISPGTGLGEGYLTRDGGAWRAHASEGGHSDFAPMSKEQEGLREYLSKKYSHVSYEKVCSGPGIHNISRYFHETEGTKCAAFSKIDELEDPTPVLVREATREETPCGTCVKTLETFVSIFGAETSNLGLKILSRNGIFISGGLTIEILPFMQKGKFMEAFLNKGRMSQIVSAMPVKVIMTRRAPLLGAAHYGLQMIS
jgi:glucokinase